MGVLRLFTYTVTIRELPEYMNSCCWSCVYQGKFTDRTIVGEFVGRHCTLFSGSAPRDSVRTQRSGEGPRSWAWCFYCMIREVQAPCGQGLPPAWWHAGCRLSSWLRDERSGWGKLQPLSCCSGWVWAVGAAISLRRPVAESLGSTSHLCQP